MESWENLFASGRFIECSLTLGKLLNTFGTSAEENLDVRLSYFIQHNKAISDALSYDWFDEEANVNELHQIWCGIYIKMTNLCDVLRCDLLTSNFAHEVFLVATLNLLSWSWENLGDHYDGYIDKINGLTLFSLQTELSLCGESALEAEDLLDLTKLYQKCLWKIPPQKCNILLDIISLSFLHKLRFENCEQVLACCLSILKNFFDILPQICIHLESGTLVEKSCPLFRLGPNIASLESDSNLSVNLVVIVTILYLLRLKFDDEAWHLLQETSFAKHKNVDALLEYLKALVCLRRNDLDRSLYHIKRLSSEPLESHMIKRKNILTGWIHMLKGDHKTALLCLRDNTGLPEDDDQLPIHVYLMAHCYGCLGEPEQQLVLLDCVVDVLREDPRYACSRVTPISSLQDRLLRCLHQQPELSLFQTLLAVAEVCMKASQPEKACDCLLEALRLKKCCPDYQEKPCDFVKTRSFQSVMRDAIVASLKCGDRAKAQILCNGLMESSIFEKESFLNQAITRILLADTQTDAAMEKGQEILLKAVQLLKKLKGGSSDEKSETSQVLINTLIARVFYRKAKLFSCIGYNDDATGYFKRALALKEGDNVVLREYYRHLLIIGNTDEAGKILEKVKTLPTSTQRLKDISTEDDITLNYLIYEKVKGC